MFKIYDLNMKEIPFPDGVIPLEIFVGSVGKERTVDTVDGRPGVVDYGFNYTDRPVSLFLRIKAADAADFRLLRSEVFATFDVGSAFYVAEADVPSRVLKVVVDESYIPDRLTEEYADFDINCRTLDSVFWESKYTTLELHDSGYSATAEKYGLVDNIDDEKVKYRFTQSKNRVSLSGNTYERGMIVAANGNNASNSATIRLTGSIAVQKGVEYTFIDLGGNADVDRWWIMEYDSSGAFIGAMSTGASADRKSITFVTKGNSIRFFAQARSGTILELSDVGVNILPNMDVPEEATNFTVYNAGNVTVEPESMFLHIFATNVNGSEIIIRNNTTNEEFKLTNNMIGRNIQVNGMNVLNGTINMFRNTNRRFISLAPGNNDITVTGATFNEIRFNFKYLYK